MNKNTYRINENLSRTYLYTECAYSECEPHCSNGIAVMAIAPNVIPRSKATWESPK